MHVSPSHLPLPQPRVGPSADGSLLLLQGSKEREAVLLVSQNPPSAPCISLSQFLPWVALPSHSTADRRRAGRTQAADYRERRDNEARSSDLPGKGDALGWAPAQAPQPIAPEGVPGAWTAVWSPVRPPARPEFSSPWKVGQPFLLMQRPFPGPEPQQR